MARLRLSPAGGDAPDAATAPSAGVDLRHLPIDQLYLHPMNPRREPPEAEIAALADSIAALGLLQNLLGYDDPDADPAFEGMPGIVAGGRRLRALQRLAERGLWSGPVPVIVTHSADVAAEWAGAENETHVGLPVADRIAAYGQMRRTGATIDVIASAFATPVSDVRRLLALANLPAPVIDALRAERIGLDVAKALTSVRDETDQLQLLDAVLTGNLPAWQLRKRIGRDRVSATSAEARYLGLEAYHDAGGTSTLDLFEDRTWLHDGALLKRLAHEKAEAEVEAIRAAEGWAWARFVLRDDWHAARYELQHVRGEEVPLPEGDAERLEHLAELEERTEAEEAELEDLERRADRRLWSDDDLASCGILAKINHSGALIVERAYRTKAAAAAAEGDDIPVVPPAPEAAMPQNLKDDLARIRLICIQDAVLRDEVFAHSMLALQFAGRLKPWEEPFNLTWGAAPAPGKMDGFAIPTRLQEPADQTLAKGGAAQVLADWVDESDGTVDRHLYEGLARAFCRVEGPFVDLLHARTPVTPRSLWRPTAAGFLNRISAGALDAIWRELIPEDTGSARDGFFSLTKKEKAAQLERLFEGHDLREAMGLSRKAWEAIDAWLPEALRFNTPATADDAQGETGAEG